MPRGRPFLAGLSGNPGGRPKVIAELRDLARAHTPELMAELIRLALHADSESVRLGAIQAALDRGWGKAITPIQVSPGTPGSDALAVVTGELPAIDAQLVRGADGVHRVIEGDKASANQP
jgi:hypothetical protein